MPKRLGRASDAPEERFASRFPASSTPGGFPVPSSSPRPGVRREREGEKTPSSLGVAPGNAASTNRVARERVESVAPSRAPSSPSSDVRPPGVSLSLASRSYPRPSPRRRSLTFPARRARPRAITAALRHSASHSSIECEVTTTHAPRSAHCAPIARLSASRDSGSIPALGSSRRTRLGSPTSAIATESLRRVPPLSFPAGTSRNAESSSADARRRTSGEERRRGPPRSAE